MQPETNGTSTNGAASLELMLANGLAVPANTDVVVEDPWLIKARDALEQHKPKAGKSQRLERGSVISFGDMKRTDWPEPSWLVEGLVESGPSTFAIIGAPKACKSWLAMELAMAVACGEGAFGYPKDYPVQGGPRRAVLVNAENKPKSMLRRLRGLECGKTEDTLAPDERGRLLDANLFYLKRQPLNLLDDPQLVAFLAEMLETASTGKIDLLILDPLRDLFDIEDEQSATEMGRAMDRLRIISLVLDCAVGVVHHAKKSQGNRELNVREMSRGSGAFIGKVDAAIGMGNPRGPDKQHLIQDMLVITRDGQGAEPCTMTLVLEDDAQKRVTKAHWVREPLDERGNANKPFAAAKEQRVAGLKEEVLGFLRAAARPYGADAIAAELGRANVNVRAVVKELADANEIEQGRVGRITGWSIRGRATPPLNGVETADQG